MLTRLRWATMLVVCAAALPVTAAANRLEEFRYTDSKTFDVGAAPDVSIETISGDCSYTAVDGTTATVDVVIRVRAKNQQEADEIRDAIELEIEGENGFLNVSMKRADRFYQWLNHAKGGSRSTDVSFHVKGPLGADGSLTSVSGDVRAEGVTGRMELKSVSGDVTAERLGDRLIIGSTSGDLKTTDCKGPISAETVSGDMNLESTGADLKIHTVSGDAMIGEVAGACDFHSVSGDVEIRGAHASVSAVTVSGDIHVDQDKGGFELSTTSGDITVRSAATATPLHARSISGTVTIAVDPAAVGEVTLESPSGDIRADVDMKVRRHSDHRLEGLIGNGDGVLSVSTVSGDILLSKL
ncbi:MAG: DUF4097 family beta strand repeat protein [candidate division Zixibacteria bacterium]|nr:DUF4097 family beta strand repeat protein [candidate division Zixibacteria bacterium]